MYIIMTAITLLLMMYKYSGKMFVTSIVGELISAVMLSLAWPLVLPLIVMEIFFPIKD